MMSQHTLFLAGMAFLFSCLLGWGLATKSAVVDSRLSALAARPAAHTLNHLSPVLVPVAFFGCFFLPLLWPIVGIATIGAVLPWRPQLLVRLTGGPNASSLCRRAWLDLEKVASVSDGRDSAAERSMRADEIIDRLQKLRTSETDKLIDLLAVQAREWVAPNPVWSRVEVLREIELYELATRLWPGDFPGVMDTSLDPQFLWEFFDAYQTYLEASQARRSKSGRGNPDVLLSRLRTFRRPQSERFIDLITELHKINSRARHGDEAQANLVAQRAQEELDRLFPGVWVFRGAHIDGQSSVSRETPSGPAD